MSRTLNSTLLLCSSLVSLVACAPAELGSGNDGDGGGSDSSVMQDGALPIDGAVPTDGGVPRDGSTPTDAWLTDGGRIVTELAGPVGPIDSEDVTPTANPYGVQDYFIDCAGGDDSNNGLTAATPWRTIHKFNTTASGILQPGARVFFKRGGVCHGDGAAERYSGTVWLNPSGTAERNIEYKAYGTGAAPVISGAIVASGWTVESGSIYHTNIGSGRPVKYLFVGDEAQTLARSPNKDSAGRTTWLLTDDMNGNGDGTTFIRDSELPTPAANNLVGATAFYRHDNWSFAAMEIVAHSGTTITMSTPDSQCYSPHCSDSVYPAAGWGYIVENDRQLLDHPGEWFYDSATGDLSFWAPGSVDPNSITVEVVVDYHAFYFHDALSNITIANLVIEKYRDAIVEIGDSPGVPGDASHITLRNTVLRYGYLGLKNGTSSEDPAQGNDFLNLHIHDVYNCGIYNGGNGHLYRGNLIERVAIQPDLGGDRSLWAYFAYQNVSGASTFTQNIIRNVGYSGVNHIGGGEISSNLIEDIGMTLNDGCAICSEPVTGVLVRRNLVRGAHGNLDGLPPDFVNGNSICSGISTGDHSNLNGIFEENVVSDFANGGITLDNNFHSRNITVRGNTVYTAQPGDGLGAAGLQFLDQSVGVGGSCDRADYGCFVENFGHQIYSNRVYMLHPNTQTIRFVHLLTDGEGHSVDYGSFWDNYIFQPHRLDSIHERRTWGGVQVGDIAEVAPASVTGANQTINVYSDSSVMASVVGMRTTGDNGVALEQRTVSSFVWWRVDFDGSTADGWVREYELRLAQKTIEEWQVYAHEPPAEHVSTPNRSAGYLLSNEADFPPIYVNDSNEPVNVNVGTGRCDSNGNALPEIVTLEHFADVIVPERCADQP